MTVQVGVAAGVSVADAVGEAVWVGVEVGESVSVADGVGEGVSEGVKVPVAVADDVGVEEGVWVGDAVGVAVAVIVGESVPVTDGVGDEVSEEVGVTVKVEVAAAGGGAAGGAVVGEDDFLQDAKVPPRVRIKSQVKVLRMGSLPKALFVVEKADSGSSLYDDPDARQTVTSDKGPDWMALSIIGPISPGLIPVQRGAIGLLALLGIPSPFTPFIAQKGNRCEKVARNENR